MNRHGHDHDHDRNAKYRHHHHRHPAFDFEDNQCAIFLTKLACKIPVVLVLCIAGGDSYILFGYSRLVLEYELGDFLSRIALAIYSVSMSLLLISYFRCMLTSCAVKDNPPPADFDASRCPKCDKCGSLKPPRTHHCSLCRTCTLKMDHHCPWVGNCVGLQNYKYFLVFLFWVSVTSAIYGVLTGFSMFMGYKTYNSPIIIWCVLSLFITVSFCCSVGGFFFFHVHLLIEAKTTIESLKYGRHAQSPYKIKGNTENFDDIFGDNKWLWLLPIIYLKETGYELFDANEYPPVQRSTYGNGDGVSDALMGNQAQDHINDEILNHTKAILSDNTSNESNQSATNNNNAASTQSNNNHQMTTTVMNDSNHLTTIQLSPEDTQNTNKTKMMSSSPTVASVNIKIE